MTSLGSSIYEWVSRCDWVPALVFLLYVPCTSFKVTAVSLCSWFWRWACWPWWCISTPWWPSTSSESSTTRVKTGSHPTWSVTTCWLWVGNPLNALYEVLTCWLSRKPSQCSLWSVNMLTVSRKPSQCSLWSVNMLAVSRKPSQCSLWSVNMLAE